MAAKKKTVAKKKRGKITKAPSGVSFMYESKPRTEKISCPDCGKGHVVMTRGGFPTCNAGSTFRCSKRCGWKSPNGRKPKPQKKVARKKAKKKGV